MLIAQIEDLNEGSVKKHYGRVGPDRSIVLNDSASPKMVIKIYSNFLQLFVKVLQLFECRRSDPYMTAYRNFVRFSHS